MLYDPSTAPHLKPWLVRTLEPICDAEPGALADYILALLNHNGPEAELRRELSSQLEEFLEKETGSFINTLFVALRSKSYLPYSAPSPPPTGPTLASSDQTSGGIPIPLDALLNPSDTFPSEARRKRNLEYDDRDRPVKGPRLNDGGNFSRYARGDRGSWGGRGDNGSRMLISGRADYMDGGGPAEGGMANGRGYRPQERRGICRDYYNTGYCARGAYCKYSHGEDAMVPNQLFPMAGAAGFMGGMGILPNGAPIPFPMSAGSPNPAYDPHERIDMRPMRGDGHMGGPMNRGGGFGGRPQIMARDGIVNGMRKHGELPVIQDLTPQIPQDGLGAPAESGTEAGAGPMAGIMSTYPHDPLAAGISRDVDMTTTPSANGRPRAGVPNPHNIPRRTGDKTLVVEKIPSDKLSISAINDWFKRFGSVTNVAVDTRGGKALVSFSEHEMAYKAWKGEEAVFGNRFVKVFWHRPVEGKGEMGTKMLASSGELMAKVSAREQQQQQKPPAPVNGPSTSTAGTRKPSTATSSAAAALAAKQQLLEQQIAEQKDLMTKLATASTPAEKKEIMARLRKLNEEMKPSSTPAPTPNVASAAPIASKASGGSTPLGNEEAEKVKLDKELDIHGAEVAMGETEEENTDELKARLAKLKAEAASLGLTDPSESQPYHNSGGYRGYRGRGRGARSYYRGAMRGGPPRGSMKLDNRPKRLLVKGVTRDDVEKVREWYETALVGQVEGVEVLEGSGGSSDGEEGEGGVVVAFRSRAAAEQGLAKGTQIPSVDKSLQISWYTGQPSTTSFHPKPIAANGTAHTSADVGDKDTPMDGLKPSREAGALSGDVDEDSHMGGAQEEEVSGGWGVDEGDDGFGMI